MARLLATHPAQHPTRDVTRLPLPHRPVPGASSRTIRLADLTSRHVAAMFAAIAAGPNRRGQPYATGTLQRICATLRAALNGAIRDGMLVSNAANRVELPNPRRPHPVVWTKQRIAEWRRTGIRPAVAVWSPRQLATFLEHVRDERLYALWWLVALRGLRRGEAVGLPWDNVDLDRRQLTISQQLTVDASTFAFGVAVGGGEREPGDEPA
jgi:integrase